ncbi:MAG: RelA/SpoT family protein [Odoribacteraceae bacterium]|jgi:GTP pyrophosphokinase|nr:RelA/SpoT family protein [Odoribacteraceae bacterium]
MNEQEIINAAFEDLMNSLRKETTEENRQLIREAFQLANEAHKGVKRKSGVPYILHPIAVAKIASVEIGLGTKSVMAALLHDVVEDANYTIEDISMLFGPKIASLVDGLTKISGVMGMNTTKQAENFRKIILTIADDVRVILLKIADRLHNMRTLDSLPEHKRVKIAGETLFIYAPLAHRIGLYAIKSELEDLSLKHENPDEYALLQGRVQRYRYDNMDFVQRFISPIRERLIENGYKFEIVTRTKSVYSVWSRMQRENITFDEILDILSVRVIFDPKDDQPEKWQCWHIYSLVTDLYSPRQESIRDWISVPKSNGYEALHVTVMRPGGGWIEIQVRTTRMDDIDEKGLAAQWKYRKEDADPISELDKWLINIKEMLERTDSGALELLDDFKLNLFAKEIQVFTPKGDKKTLPKGATVLDFAYEIHTELGNACIGAKVNHVLEPVSHVLHDGDQVEVLTSDTQVPHGDWINFIVTAKAKHHIMATFRKERKEQIRKGMVIFENLLSKTDNTPTQELLNRVLLHLKLGEKDDLYLGLFKQQISTEEVRKALKRKSKNKLMHYWKLQFFKSDKERTSSNGQTANTGNNKETEQNDDIPNVIIAPDCNPIPGDDVVALKIDEGKIIVHKRKCPEAIRLMASHGDRIVPVKWVSYKVVSFLAAIRLSGIDTIGIVSEITRVISKENNVNMRSVHFDTKDGIFDGIIYLYIQNTADLTSLMTRIASLNGVEKVIRVENIEAGEFSSRK